MRHGATRSIAAVVMAAGLFGCADNPGEKVPETKIDVVMADGAKSVQLAILWSQALTAKLVANEMAAPGVADLGTNSGVLSAADPSFSDGRLFDEWSYEASAGDELTVSVSSGEFDTFVMIIAADDDSDMGLLAEDDDSGEGSNSVASVAFAKAGSYAIMVTSYGPGDTGGYNLSLERTSSQCSSPAECGDMSTITNGNALQAELGSEDGTLGDGGYYQEWSYHGTAGEELTISLVSPDFDTFLMFGRGRVGSSFEMIGENDDGGDGYNSLLDVVVPETATFTIVATSYVGESGPTGGSFELSVEVEAPPNWPEIYPGGGDPAGRYALLVGVDDYPGEGNDLNGPRADAGIMYEILVESYGFPEENILLLEDADANRENITNAFLRHLGQAGPDGVAVFFYSGHGTQLESNIGLGEPLDPEANGTDEALVVWGEGDETGLILDDELGFLADQLQTSRTWIVIDACFSGTVSRGPSEDIQSKGLQQRDMFNLRLPKQLAGGLIAEAKSSGGGAIGALDLLSRPERHVLLAASSENELSWAIGSWPDRDGPASVFTYYLQKVITDLGPSASFEEIHAEVVARVAQFQEEAELPPQTPQVGGRAVGTASDVFLRSR
jgi:caspase domain-containing protein